MNKYLLRLLPYEWDHYGQTLCNIIENSITNQKYKTKLQQLQQITALILNPEC